MSVNFLFYQLSWNKFCLSTCAFSQQPGFLAGGRHHLHLQKMQLVCLKHPVEVYIGSAILHQMSPDGRCPFCLHQYAVRNKPVKRIPIMNKFVIQITKRKQSKVSKGNIGSFYKFLV